MDRNARRAAVADYKKRKSVAGIFCMRSSASGECWIGHSPVIDTIENRLRFSLRAGSHMNRALQSAWNRDGEDAFSFEPVELVDEETLGFTPDKVLKARAADWCARLSARSI